MQTRFNKAQLGDPKTANAEGIIRNCVHCGFCTATCPTYILLGNELDSPRGRIYLIKEMLENDRAATEVEVEHIDKCLSCLSCVTTCPSGVDYMHLIDHARNHIEKTYQRPLKDKMLRKCLAYVLVRPRILKWLISLSFIAKPVKMLLPKELRAMLELMPQKSIDQVAALTATNGAKKYRMGLHAGCVQRVIGENINTATVDFLSRRGVEIVAPPSMGCCGSLTQHMGKEDISIKTAKAYIDGWTDELVNGKLDAIVINTSGCGTTIKDYGYLFKDDPIYAERANAISDLAKDITEVVADIGLGDVTSSDLPSVAYHPACSLKHGQKIIDLPMQLLEQAGYKVHAINESHICCGSAGTYNITHPDIAKRLRSRKLSNIKATNAQVIATGNLGCIVQLSSGTKIPTLHTIELINWATGGKKPVGLKA